ncbi:hypothetical protein CEXT_734861 [Caerostris extrusa]|uniref:Uncharacterized protein n=1 Tax=Caerostris extrusa TaxID=172846 RepID=A0AAV4MNB3_CAEEX|nr:hypothetical protein CEXT_734861 [Caerostris extrusa]
MHLLTAVHPGGETEKGEELKTDRPLFFRYLRQPQHFALTPSYFKILSNLHSNIDPERSPSALHANEQDCKPRSFKRGPLFQYPTVCQLVLEARFGN